ncbi:MAG TPA: GNAT family protein [Longimicrobium sp.]|nr:GNAT family protein [Longimicrobium sp.]
MDLTPVVLEGRHVRMVPLELEHLPALWEVARDEELWRWTQACIRTPADLRRYVETALRWQAQGTALPFATTLAADGRVVGSTRFANADPEHRRVEIGWTWVGAPWQRTAVNTEAKYLMLRHAFETLGCIRVELKTDALNDKSRRAIARIGGIEEGTLRSHNITETGRRRDTVYFSILDGEWPGVKQRLEAALAAPEPGTPAP